MPSQANIIGLFVYEFVVGPITCHSYIRLKLMCSAAFQYYVEDLPLKTCDDLVILSSTIFEHNIV
jgi:hypothetical protein